MGLGKGRQAEALPWKLKLYATLQEDYSSAQQIMDRIVAITNQKPGKLGGKVQPRICTSCGRWGHTKAHCDYWRHVYEDRVGPPPSVCKEIKTDVDSVIVRREDYTENDWKWVMEYRRLMHRYRSACAVGKQYNSDWDDFCKSFDAEHPSFPCGTPHNLTQN